MKWILLPVLAVVGLAGTPSSARSDDPQPDTHTPAVPLSAVPDAEPIDKKHPDFVVCRSESVIGSLAKRRKVCLTNRQWSEVQRDGNGLARKTVEDARAGMVGQ